MSYIMISGRPLISSKTTAKDFTIKVYRDDKYIRLKTTSKHAKININGDSIIFDIINRIPIAVTALEREVKIIGEKLVDAQIYTLENGSDDMILAVIEGQSGTKYLGLVTIDVDIIGASRVCR
ncbi:hypothetical protein [Bdellovibrio sp. HCB-110]|uniref:hypothetical protein n=1 Tax=Bdellovibrio sp. HCB-110 TaxID=3391182 RepID=UPI0039B3DB11